MWKIVALLFVLAASALAVSLTLYPPTMQKGVNTIVLRYDACGARVDGGPDAGMCAPVVLGTIDACGSTKPDAGAPLLDCGRANFTLSPTSTAATGAFNAGITAWKKARGY